MPEPLSDHVAISDIVTGTPEVGLWCGTCLLPSAYRATIYILGEDGPRVFATAEGCTEHDQR